MQDCLRQGAQCLVGGSPHDELNLQGGCFFQPTVLTEVTRDMKVGDGCRVVGGDVECFTMLCFALLL